MNLVPARRIVLFVTTCVTATAVALPGLLALIGYSTRHDAASHTLLVPAVSATLVWLDRRTIFATLSGSRVGIPVVLAGIGIAAASTLGMLPGGAAAAVYWAPAAIVVSWAGAFLLVFGAAASRAALFPLLFLALTIPIPETALAEAVRFLKGGSAGIVAALFSLTGTPHLRDGFIFELPGFVIEIADECSGIRSTIALSLTSLLAGHLFLGSPSRKALLLFAVLPIAILKNAVRIVTLSLLAIHVDPSFLVGQLHHEGGVLFFLLAIALLVPILSLLRASETGWSMLPRVTHLSTR